MASYNEQVSKVNEYLRCFWLQRIWRREQIAKTLDTNKNLSFEGRNTNKQQTSKHSAAERTETYKY